VWIDWVFWFNRTYKDGPKMFHELALYSFEYVHWSNAQVNYHANAPVMQTGVATNVVNSD
jgi:hypothetical protein